MTAKSKFIRMSAVGFGVLISYSVAMGLMGGCGKKAADPVAAAPAASASPSASASPDASPSASPSVSPTPPVVFTSDSFSGANGTFVGPSPSPTILATDIVDGGTAKNWYLSPNDGSTFWQIASGHLYLGGTTQALVSLGLTTGYTSCTVKVKLAKQPAAGSLTGLSFRLDLTGGGGNNYTFVNDNGLLASLPGMFPVALDRVAGYKFMDGQTASPAVMTLADGVTRNFTITPADNDVLQVTVTPTHITATVTPATGDPETHTITNSVNPDYTGMGVTSSDKSGTSGFFKDFVIQDCQ